MKAVPKINSITGAPHTAKSLRWFADRFREKAAQAAQEAVHFEARADQYERRALKIEAAASKAF